MAVATQAASGKDEASREAKLQQMPAMAPKPAVRAPSGYWQIQGLQRGCKHIIHIWPNCNPGIEIAHEQNSAQC